MKIWNQLGILVPTTLRYQELDSLRNSTFHKANYLL